MGWDVIVMDIPKDLTCVDEWPPDFEPQPLGTQAEIIAKIKEVCPDADLGEPDPSWGNIFGDGFAIDVSIGDDDPVMHFAFHVYGGGNAHELISAILTHMGLRALDSYSPTSLFEPSAAGESFRQSQEYRDYVRRRVNGPGPGADGGEPPSD